MRAMLTLGLAAVVATPAAAQWLGMPVWNSPKGGTGLTISADYGKPNGAYGAGNAFGGRASLGVGTLTLTAGVSSYKSDSIGPDRVTTWGGNAAFRLIGGSLLPFSLNLQAGAAPPGRRGFGRGPNHLHGRGGVFLPLPPPRLTIGAVFSPR